MLVKEYKEELTLYSKWGDEFKLSLEEFYEWVRENLPSCKGKSLRQISLLIQDNDMLSMYNMGLGVIVKKGRVLRHAE